MTAPQSGRHLLGALGTVVVGAVVVVGVSGLLRVLAAVPPTLRARPVGVVQTAVGPLTRASLTLSTYPDSLAGEHGSGGGAHPGWVSYGPTTNLWVPAHALVTVTIRNYDGATTLTDPFYGRVQGTVGGVEWVNGRATRGVPAAQVAHTFTIHMFPTPGQPLLDVSVPLPGVPASTPVGADGYPAPTVVTFQFRTGASGRYIWQCEDPCGTRVGGFGGPMSTQGYMTGTLVVGHG